MKSLLTCVCACLMVATACASSNEILVAMRLESSEIVRANEAGSIGMTPQITQDPSASNLLQIRISTDEDLQALAEQEQISIGVKATLCGEPNSDLGGGYVYEKEEAVDSGRSRRSKALPAQDGRFHYLIYLSVDSIPKRSRICVKLGGGDMARKTLTSNVVETQN